MSTSRFDLLSHDFPRSFRGYSPKHVELFIQDLADSIARLGEEKVMLLRRVEELEAKLARHEKNESSLRETLVATQRMMEDLKNSAQREAQLIIEAARGKAENLTAQGSLRLARITDEIAEARRIKAQFEYHVRSIIEAHLKLLKLGNEEEHQLMTRAEDIGRHRNLPAEQAAPGQAQPVQPVQAAQPVQAQTVQAQTVQAQAAPAATAAAAAMAAPAMAAQPEEAQKSSAAPKPCSAPGKTA